MTQSFQSRLGWGIWIALLAINTPSAILHSLNQLQFSESRVLPFLLLLGLVLIFFCWNKQIHAPNRIGWMLIASAITFAILSLFRSTQIAQPTGGLSFGALAFALTIVSFLASHFSAKLPTQSLFRFSTILAVWFVFPIGTLRSFVSVLRSWSGSLAGQILDSLSVSNRTYADFFELTDMSWRLDSVVGDAYSSTTLLAMACLWIAMQVRSYILLPIYMFSAVLWGTLADSLRLTTISLAFEWYELDWTHGWKWNVNGLVGLLFGISMFWSTDRLFMVLFQPTDSDNSQGLNPLVQTWNTLFATMRHRPSGSSSKHSSRSKAVSKHGVGI